MWSSRLPFRVVLASAFWIAIWVPLTMFAPSWGTPGLLLTFGGWSATTFALGYYVRDWWAMLVPTATFVIFEAVVIYDGFHGATTTGVVVASSLTFLVFGAVIWFVEVGIEQAERTGPPS
jgi:hypothetical protein